MRIRALLGGLMLGALSLFAACGGESEEEPAEQPAPEEPPPPGEPAQEAQEAQPSQEDHEAMGHAEPDPEPQPAGDGHTDHQH